MYFLKHKKWNHGGKCHTTLFAKEENNSAHQLYHEVSQPFHMGQGKNEQYFVPSVTSQ